MKKFNSTIAVTIATIITAAIDLMGIAAIAATLAEVAPVAVATVIANMTAVQGVIVGIAIVSVNAAIIGCGMAIDIIIDRHDRIASLRSQSAWHQEEMERAHRKECAWWYDAEHNGNKFAKEMVNAAKAKYARHEAAYWRCEQRLAELHA